jgi:diguanylate cyclase (GGDEF)-like protein
MGYMGIYSRLTAVHNEQHLLLDDLVHAQASALERRLSRSLSSTYILAQEVRRSNGNFRDFDKFAAEVIKSLGGISNLQLAPKGIVERIYPIAGNEKAIGHKILIDDARAKEANLAIKKRGLTLAGPFELIQGGIALIGRNPVFLEKDGEEYFWGFTSALIYLDELMAATELGELSAKGYQFQLSRIHPDSGEAEIFFRSEADLLEHSIIKAINVPNSSWNIAISRDSGYEFHVSLSIASSFVLAVIFALLLNRIFLEPERLRKKVNQQTHALEQLAFHDELTGLANRRFLTEKLEQEILNLKRHGRHLAILYIDLDDFKRINDTLGHDMGDVLLKTVAGRIRDMVRESDIVARMGGDEFAVILLDLKGADHARLVAEKIIENVGCPMILDEHEVVIGSTIGITLAPDDSFEIGELFRNADLAMYDSKRAGKNRYSFFDTEMQQIVTEHLLMEESLRQAIANNEFYLVYQPIISLDTYQLQKFEALIRWRHPLNGEQSPGDFIGVAEETGLIMPIGYWVLREACQFINDRQQKWLEAVPITINISSAQLKDENFGHRVEEIINATDVDPKLIELEITESVLMEDIELALQLINQVKQLGMKICIDDFGAGYSSLTQLKKFPVDTFKIDRGIVMDLDDDPNDRQIVEAITAMVHKLGIIVVAEGIETESQLRFLRNIGCDSGQGFLFSKPLSADDVVRFDYPVSISDTDRKQSL